MRGQRGGTDVWSRPAHPERGREMAGRNEEVRRGGDAPEICLETDRRICHRWRDEVRGVSRTGG